MGKPKLNKSQIKVLFNDLFDESKFTPQQRGFKFEELIESKLESESLEPRASYKPKGEQIDGSFFWEGSTFLLEAKWVKQKLPASSIYAFKGKLDGKFHTTSGVFMSVNGYSKDAEDALKYGKSLNVILFDTSDIKLIFNGDITFLEVLKFKLRAAGDTGSLNVPYKLINKVERISKLDTIDFINQFQFDKQITKKKRAEDLLIFVEGQNDIQIVDKFLKPIELDFLVTYKIVVLDGANNIRQIPSLLNLYADYRHTKGVLVFLDNDQETIRMNNIIEKVREQIENSSIPIQTKFFFIDNDSKIDLLDKKLENIIFDKKLPKPKLYLEIERFVNEISYEYYNPEVDIPMDSIKSEMHKASWDYENQKISFSDDFTGFDFTIDNLDELIKHLNDKAISDVHGSMPLYLLKEKDYVDYEDEVREYLADYYKKEIEKLEWNSEDI